MSESGLLLSSGEHLRPERHQDRGTSSGDSWNLEQNDASSSCKTTGSGRGWDNAAIGAAYATDGGSVTIGGRNVAPGSRIPLNI